MTEADFEAACAMLSDCEPRAVQVTHAVVAVSDYADLRQIASRRAARTSRAAGEALAYHGVHGVLCEIVPTCRPLVSGQVEFWDAERMLASVCVGQ